MQTLVLPGNPAGEKESWFTEQLVRRPYRVKALALRVLADRLEHGETVPDLLEVFSVAA
jgi:hypothetical protein